MEIKFKRDTAFRKTFFVPDSFAHPAKMDAQLLIWLVENYTKVGDVILDPMFGSGTAMLACTLGRNVIGVELEQKFVDMSLKNWEEVKMRPQLGYDMGWCEIIQGDARNLDLLADTAIFSPPFSEQGAHEASKYFPRPHRGTINPQDFHNNNIGNLKYGEIDAVISSPPYGNPRDINEKSEQEYENDRLGETDKQHGRTQFRGRYQVDAVISSPPYEAAVSASTGGERDQSSARQREKRLRDKGYDPAKYQGGVGRNLEVNFQYSKADGNIGNLKSTNYLEAMLQVYLQCYKCLKPEGLLILVLKNFIRNKQVVRLDLDTIKLCEQAGFSFKESHQRELPAQSFWRVIYHQKHPEVEQIKYEDILIFGKSVMDLK